MYVPPAFSADDETALAMLGRAALGALVTSGPEGLSATHLPMLIEHEPLRAIGHVARANPVWRASSGEGLLIVQAANAYVSPSFYPSKAEHGRVVPTWNYEAIHLRGELSFFEDGPRLLHVVEELTTRFEQDRDTPWAVSDAPANYVNRMLDAIVGVELRITGIEAVRKLSQNKSETERAGVIAGLDASSLAGDRAVAEAMRR